MKSNLKNAWSYFTLKRVNSAFLMKGRSVAVCFRQKELSVTFKAFRRENISLSLVKTNKE